MPVTPYRDRFQNPSALTGSSVRSSLPEIGVSSSFDLMNRATSGMDTSKIDRFRQGVSVVSRRYIRRDSPSTIASTNRTATIGCLPILTSDGLNGEKIEDIHSISLSEFGQPKLFLDYEPFEDMASMRINTKIVSGVTSAYGGPISFIEDTGGSQLYPATLFDPALRDPDQLSGIIEPLSIRDVLSTRGAETPFTARKISACIIDGNFEKIHGSDRILQETHLTGSTVYDSFIDSAETAMVDGSGFVLFAPGFSSDIKVTSTPFIDDTYDFYKVLVGTGSVVRSAGLVDRDRRSAKAGFVYANNPLGTDSIAFGGLKREK
jgi:hypothetical protein